MSESRLLAEFVGFLSADVPELHEVEVPRLVESIPRFLSAKGARVMGEERPTMSESRRYACHKCGQMIQVMPVMKYHRNGQAWCPGSGEHCAEACEPSAPLASPREGWELVPRLLAQADLHTVSGRAFPIANLLREAAQSLESATLREQQVRELVEKWRKEADESHPMVSISHPMSLRELLVRWRALVGERETTQK